MFVSLFYLLQRDSQKDTSQQVDGFTRLKKFSVFF